MLSMESKICSTFVTCTEKSQAIDLRNTLEKIVMHIDCMQLDSSLSNEKQITHRRRNEKETRGGNIQSISDSSIICNRHR